MQLLLPPALLLLPAVATTAMLEAAAIAYGGVSAGALLLA
jgi:hypothetical protein